MLKTRLLHPEILEALGSCGHSSKILIADGNYPFATQLGANARLVSLNLAPGLLNATQVLEVLASAVPFEEATVMNPVASGPYSLPGDPEIWPDFARILEANGSPLPLQRLDRFAFFDAAKDENVIMTIATGEQRLYANLLLQIGVVFPDAAA